MAALDARGIIAAVQIALYVPIAVTTGILIVRFALRRDAGWLFLFIFALTRVTDGALIVAGESAKTKPDLFTAAYILQAVGLGLLMLASLGFIGLVGQRTFSDYPRFRYLLRILGLVAVVAVIFTVAGGLLGSPVSPKHGSAGLVLRRIGACVFGISFILIVFVHFDALTYRWHIRTRRRQLLTALFSALPFLGARSAYAILAAWSSSDLYGRSLSRNAVLAATNPVTGKYQYFLGLSVLCELAVTLIYLISTTTIMLT